LGRVAVLHHSSPLPQEAVVAVVVAARDALSSSVPSRAAEVAVPRVPGSGVLAHDEANVIALGF
jgi:hypothetical protein